MRYAGRTIVITGAAGGLGSGMAAAFAAEGAAVALVDLPGSPGEELAARINAGLTGSEAGGPAGGSPGQAFFLPCVQSDLAATRPPLDQPASPPAGAGATC